MTARVAATLLTALLMLPAAALADPITIDARNADLSDVIRMIASQAGENVVVDASVKPQRISVHLHDVDPQAALTALAQAYGLHTQREGAILIVGAARFARGSAPVVPGAPAAQIVTLSNERPSDVIKSLHTIVPDATAVADDRSNNVLLSGSNDALSAAGGLLAGLDLPGRQVVFEVRVTDVKPNDDSSNVGIEFGGTGYGAAGAQGQFTWAIAHSPIVVNAQINALVQKGKAQILATPRIATINNKEASLLVGEQYPVVIINQQTGYPTVQTVDVGVRLRVTPTIGDDGTITAELHPEYSQIIGFNSNFPIIASRKVDATLRVHDGDTIILGGLFEDTSSETITKVPWLADIPVLGAFFRNKQTSEQRDEVVFFITPHLL